MSVSVAKNFSQYIDNPIALPVWSPDGRTVAIFDSGPDHREMWRIDLATGEKTPLIDPARLAEAVEKATGFPQSGRSVPFEHFGYVGANRIRFVLNQHSLILDLDSYGVTVAPGPDLTGEFYDYSTAARMTPREFHHRMLMSSVSLKATEVLSPDKQFFLSIRDNNLSLRGTVDGRSYPLTHDGTEEDQWFFDWIPPRLGTHEAVNWSPDGRWIAAYKLDFHGVAQHPEVQVLKRKAQVKYNYDAGSGGVLEKSTLYVVDVEGRPPVEIQLGDTRDTYPVFAGWLPDSSALLICQISRDCTRAEVFSADPETGAVKSLFVEQGESFIRNQYQVYFFRKLDLTITPDGQEMLWLSERDGWKHIYRFGSDGTPKGRLTEGDWAVQDIQKIIGRHVYFTAHSDPARPYDSHLCRVPLDGGAVEILTEGEGIHQISFGPGGNVFLDTYSTIATPPKSVLRKLDGTLLHGDVLKSDISRLTRSGWSAGEEFTVTAADGETELWGYMYRPFNFDPSKKYPVIEFIRSSPCLNAYRGSAFTIPTSMAGGALDVSVVNLTEKGFVVVVQSSRGTPDRSRAFYDGETGRWSAHMMAADHAAGIRQLIDRHNFLDGDNVSLMSYSMATPVAWRCLADSPDLYKAGVIWQPDLDPYSLALFEWYMDLPHKNPEGWKDMNPYQLAERIQSELLLICSTGRGVVFGGTMKLADALIKAGKQHDIVVIPDQGQYFSREFQDYVDVKLERFFAQHLQSKSPA